MSPVTADKQPAYPFSAVVGQDDYKLALLANAVDPAIGGVLAVGDRGTAKTTLARSFAALLPRPGVIDVSGAVDGHAASEDPATDVVDEADLSPLVAPFAVAPFVELPLGATLDRVVGSVDTANLLAGGGAQLRPGLIAGADGGVLYADEVNLLGDHLVDVLLDAAASGELVVERDGLSERLPARFVLIGTMNPEEGALRPQLLDRFGLSVEIGAPTETTDRTEITTRRLAFERDPRAFIDRFAGTEAALAEIVANARELLAAVELGDSLLGQIAVACTRRAVEGMRADIVTARTAIALAALDQRNTVIERDIVTAARLALPHRARSLGAESRRFEVDEIAQALADEKASDENAPTPRTSAGRARKAATGSGLAGATAATGRSESEESVATPKPAATPKPPATPKHAASPSLSDVADRSAVVGRSGRAAGGQRPSVDSELTADIDDLDVIATARAAVTRRLVRGGPALISDDDLRAHVRAGRDANLVLCVVDASSSVLENGRSGELRALLAGLVADARRKRDRVGLVVFRGRDARLVAPPSRNHAAVLSGLDTIEPGGTTPLAAGIRVAHEAALRELRRNPELRPIVALVTDGYANISRGGDAVGEARLAASDLRRDKITLVVIGESNSGAPEFARSTGAEFYPFDPASGQQQVA
ncbi:MAG: ATP-binding protein [Solirubrobacterales bacterium]